MCAQRLPKTKTTTRGSHDPNNVPAPQQERSGFNKFTYRVVHALWRQKKCTRAPQFDGCFGRVHIKNTGYVCGYACATGQFTCNNTLQTAQCPAQVLKQRPTGVLDELPRLNEVRRGKCAVVGSINERRIARSHLPRSTTPELGRSRNRREIKTSKCF